MGTECLLRARVPFTPRPLADEVDERRVGEGRSEEL
jgi:hypothetical protein